MQSLRPTTKRWSLVVALLLAVSLVASACGGGDDEEGGGDGDGAAGGNAETPAEPTMGGSLTYGLEAENAEGWCLPEAQLAISGIQVSRAIYDTLTAPNAEGDYVPFLAESLTPNETYDSWEIKLREGIKFHDGSDLTAEVVKNNLDAFRGQYPARNPLLFVFVFANIDTVEVTGPLTVTVTTKTPWVAFPSALFGSGRIGISAQAQLDDPDTCDRELIGTGPFEQVEWAQNEFFRARKNPDYWQTDSEGNQLPYLDEITFVPRPEAASRVNGLLSDELQMIHVSGGEQIDQLRQETESGNINSYESDQFAEVAFGQLNVSRPPFDNIDARMALIKGTDRETLNETRNFGIPPIANGPFAPGNMGYLEDTGFPEYDLDAAKEHAAAYEEATGEPLAFELLSTNDDATLQTAQLLQQMAQEAGIEVSLRDMTQSELIDTAISGEYDAMLFRNYPGGDPDIQYNWWTIGSPVNFGRFQDQQINDLMQQGRETADPAERTRIYEDVNRRFAEQGYSVWTYWVVWDIGMARDVFGVLGPDLPDGGGEPFPGLATGHPVSGIWVAE